MKHPDRTYLYGKNSVIERIKADPGSIKNIFLQENFKDERLVDIIKAAHLPARRVSEKELTKVKRADRLQGIVAEVEKFKYTPLEKLLDKSNLTLLCLDNINDPHNLGSILRITACFGGFSVVIPQHSSCEVNDTVIHVASGGENFVPVSMVNNMLTAIIKAKKAGYWVVGTVVNKGEDINKAKLPFPLCLVLGSEGKGIRHGIEKHLDIRVTLPMRGASLSFNVAMASAIFCHEVDRQRQKSKV